MSKIYRTPDERFAHLDGYHFAPHYAEIETADLGALRLHYVDEGPADAAPVLLMHGEPSWSYLYRKMIPPIAAAGHRVLAPDLIGFGKSDKPGRQSDYSYDSHVHWMQSWVEALDLKDITLFCQDWGGLIGLRLVARMPERFARVVAANTGLPTGEQEMPKAFKAWKAFAKYTPIFPVGRIIDKGTVHELTPQIRAAYDAPFPNEGSKAGARAFPKLVPVTPNDPGAVANREAWKLLEAFDKPFLTAFSDKDPITRGAEEVFKARIPGARGLDHPRVANAGHFLQEEAGPELAHIVNDFIAATSAAPAKAPA